LPGAENESRYKRRDIERKRSEDAGRPDRGSGPEHEVRVKRLAGKISCLVGILFALVGLLTTLLGYGASIAVGVMGVVLGILGYSLGSRGLGILTVVLCVVVLLFGAATGQGLIPSFEGYGR
jgi:hypothetical protein